jgi:two-component system, NarL family, sensor kinase
MSEAGPDRPTEPHEVGTAARLLVKFTAAGVVVVVLLAVAIALVARSQATDKAVGEAERIAWTAAHAVAEPLLTAGLTSADPGASATLDAAVRRYVLGGSLVRVKIWDGTGRILYSDAVPLIGQRFELGAEERTALEQGGADAEASDLTRPENALERGFGELLEVYIGLRTVTGQPVLFETYFRYDAVVEAGWDTWRRFAPLAVGALLVLELVQIPLAFALARRLQRTEARRRRLLDHAVHASRAERRRIAGDLHDGVVQDITGVTYELDAVRLRAADRNRAEPDERDTAIADAARRLRGCVLSLRTLLVDIYPPNLIAEGLGPALTDLAASASKNGVTVHPLLDGLVEPPPDVAALLYRAAQEGLRNAITHSGARQIDLTATSHEGHWMVVVDDDGRGMTPATIDERNGSGHFGLRSLGDLVADAGGELALRSSPAAGTRLEVQVPTP